MVAEVNKIIYNMLVSSRGVYLPNIGSFYIERQAARKIADNKLLSPRNVVSFTSQEQAPSLIDEITSIAKCEPSQSQDIYERWLAKTLVENTLTIEGIGKLVDKSFTMDESFDATINPQGSKILVMRRKQSHLWLYILSGVCVLFALGMLAYVIWGESTTSTKVTTTEVATVAATADAASAIEPDSTQQEAVQLAAQPQEYTFYVVMGVFAEEANAERAIEQVKSNIEDVTCSVRPFKNKHMVTIFGSDNRADCNAYANAYRDIYPNLWIYENK